MTRIVRTDGQAFGKVPNVLARDARLSNGARGLAVQLLSHKDGFRSDAEFLAQFTTDGRDAVRAQLRELREFGYLVRERVQDPDGRITTRSVVYDTPQPTGGKPATRSDQAQGAPSSPKPQVTPTGGKPATRSDQGRFAKAEPGPGAGNPPHGPTRENGEKPQVTPTGGKPATRSDQGKRNVSAGHTDRRETRLHKEDQEKTRKKISQSAQEREAARYVRGRYGDGLTDDVIAKVFEEAHARANRAGNPVGYLRGYLESWGEGDLADVVKAAMDAEDALTRQDPSVSQLPVIADDAPDGKAGKSLASERLAARATAPGPENCSARDELAALKERWTGRGATARRTTALPWPASRQPASHPAASALPDARAEATS